jgi:hypothetical protein
MYRSKPGEVGERMSDTKAPGGEPRKTYEKPTVETYPAEKILASLGPAMGNYGSDTGTGPDVIIP